jgi:hypothetical protein
MKFYNISKLNLKVGDTVYNEGGNSETIIAIGYYYMHTNKGSYRFTGLSAYLHLPTMVYQLITDRICRIHTHEIL